MIDDFNREGLAIDVAFLLPALLGVCSLNHFIQWRGKPAMIAVDNGSEYLSAKLLEWASRLLHPVRRPAGQTTIKPIF